ncbi:MAG: hypothetical protein ACRDJW_08905 [Thermomicrobiales bacterium]
MAESNQQPTAPDALDPEPDHLTDEMGEGSFDGPAHTPASALLQHFGRWVGDDLKELTDEVYRTRSKTRFE